MKNRKYLTPSEVEKLLEATLRGKHAERDYCLIWMCFIHGCRVSEISSWRLSDIDIEGNNIYIHRLKNGFSTVHPLYRRERKSLMLWMNKRLLRNYSQAANLTINAHPHMLRHGCGFALADRGIDTRLIQDYLGHRNIQNTVIYTASNANRFKEVW